MDIFPEIVQLIIFQWLFTFKSTNIICYWLANNYNYTFLVLNITNGLGCLNRWTCIYVGIGGRKHVDIWRWESNRFRKCYSENDDSGLSGHTLFLLVFVSLVCGPGFLQMDTVEGHAELRSSLTAYTPDAFLRLLLSRKY